MLVKVNKTKWSFPYPGGRDNSSPLIPVVEICRTGSPSCVLIQEYISTTKLPHRTLLFPCLTSPPSAEINTSSPLAGPEPVSAGCRGSCVEEGVMGRRSDTADTEMEGPFRLNPWDKCLLEGPESGYLCVSLPPSLQLLREVNTKSRFIGSGLSTTDVGNEISIMAQVDCEHFRLGGGGGAHRSIPPTLFILHNGLLMTSFHLSTIIAYAPTSDIKHYIGEGFQSPSPSV